MFYDRKLAVLLMAAVAAGTTVPTPASAETRSKRHTLVPSRGTPAPSGQAPTDQAPAEPAPPVPILSAPLPRQATIDTVEQLEDAVRRARPGDVITIAPGSYNLSRGIKLEAAGTAEARITLRAARLGDARFESRTQEAFGVKAPYWTVENLDIKGSCPDDSECEHAFHVAGPADGFVLRNSRLRDFNAAIKGNGLDGVFPGDVLIGGNYIYNTAPRRTRNPIALIDVVGGRHWIIRDNFIGEFGRKVGDIAYDSRSASYGAFLKGNSRDGVFENNLVICELKSQEGIRIGLSFGGGGTGQEFCENRDCAAEHTGGVMRNNIIMHCTADAGIYLNKAKNTKIYNNTLYDNFGIEVRFPGSSADIRNNIISGAVDARDGATITAGSNLVSSYSVASWVPGGGRWLESKVEGLNRKFPSLVRIDPEWVHGQIAWFGRSWFARGTNLMGEWFAAPDTADFTPSPGSPVIAEGDKLPEVTEDFCGKPRPDHPQLGAVEYADGGCDVRRRTDSGLPE